jgi:dihydroflavonol-4-reductase
MDLVTGGTGFVGTHVVRALLARGCAVRCLVRPQSRRENLEGLSVEIAEGDVTDPASLARAIAGIATLYHCAADYRLWARDPGELQRANVEGTDNVLKAAAAARVARVVYTSSVGALGLTPDGTPADETTPVSRADVVGNYKKSKFDAERVAEAWAGRGLPVVIVNPSTPVGERDVKPTPTGQLIVDFLNRRLPAYVDTGLNLVDVRDVAQGHLLAAEKGRIGEKYILGNRDMTLKEILETLAGLTGLSAPRIRLPHAVPLAAAAAATWAAHLTGRPPRVSLESVRMSRHRMFFDAGKAVRELGLPQTPVEDALGRAVAWFRENGYVRAA